MGFISAWIVTFSFSVPNEGVEPTCDSKRFRVTRSASEFSTSIWLAQDWASILSAQSTEDLERIDSLEALRPDAIELLARLVVLSCFH